MISPKKHFEVAEGYLEKLTKVVEEKLDLSIPFSAFNFNIIGLESFAHANGVDTKPLWASHLKAETGLTPDEYVSARLGAIIKATPGGQE